MPGPTTDSAILGAHRPGVPTIDKRFLLPTFVVLVVIVVSNNSAGSLAQPAIAQTFGGGPADVGWVVFGFGTTFAIGTALWGGLARRFGLGRCLTVGILLVAAGSLAAAVAPSLPALIAARVVQGFGAGAIPTLSASTIARVYDGTERARALGTVVASVGLGLALGPILGGLALEFFGWRGPMAFGVVAAPAAWLLARVGGPGDPSVRIDVPGALLIVTFVVAATFSLNRLPVLGVAAPTIVSLALLVAAAALLVRRSVKPDAFIPRRIVGNPAFTRVVVLGALGMVAFLGSLVLVPIAAARAHGLAGIGLGLVILPLAIGGVVASRQNAWVQERIGRRATSLVGLVCLAGGATAVGIVGASADPILMATVLVPLGIGFGLLQSPLVNELTVAFGDADRPLALGLYNLSFALGAASGGALATALVQAGAELPFLRDALIPGFRTTELVLALAPLLAIVFLLGQMRAARTATAAAEGTPP